MLEIKSIKLILFVSVFAFIANTAASQDVLLNILSQNSGKVSRTGSVYLEVTVCNTSSTTSVPVYKLRPQISFPSELVDIPDTGHVLPNGWSIVSHSDGGILLSNGTDMIPANECRTILISMKGNSVGGPSTISGILTFSNGIAPGSAHGSATPGDNPSDNSSTTTIQVLK